MKIGPINGGPLRRDFRPTKKPSCDGSLASCWQRTRYKRRSLDQLGTELAALPLRSVPQFIRIRAICL